MRLRGHESHGLSFAADAAARGASAVLWEPGPDDVAASLDFPAALKKRVFAAPVVNLRKLLGRIADRFFGWPSSHLRIVGITGTNGKTTCAYLLAQCLERLKLDAAYIGTLGWGRIAELKPLTHTTPDVVTLHRQLGQLRASGVREVAMEVSSHALDQARVDGVRFHSAAFTNLSRDHLDYHGTMDAYGAAKARLFEVPHLERLVVNVDDTFGRELARRVAGRVPLTAVWLGDGGSGWLADGELYASDVQLDLAGITLALGGSFGESRVATRLLGRFNAENCVVVLACLAALGVTLAEATQALAGCTAPPGVWK